MPSSSPCAGHDTAQPRGTAATDFQVGDSAALESRAAHFASLKASLTFHSSFILLRYFGSVGPTIDLLTPGESRQLQLPYTTFHEILSSGSTVFAQVYAAEWARVTAARPRGALLSIQSVRKVDAGGTGPGAEDPFAPAPPVVTAEVRCTGRADIVGVADGPDDVSPEPWTVMRGVGLRVCDERAGGIAERLGIATAEWEAWGLCQEVSRLQGRLGARAADAGRLERVVPIEQELRVWAPREYDREITESEWAQTPAEVREVWQARAESLSFAVLRRCASSEECMRRAMEIVRTGERLSLALEELKKTKAVALAKLSIDSALGNDRPGPGVDGDGM